MATNRDFVVKNGLVVTEGVTAASLDISGDVDIDGTLEADAITLNGTSLATSATTDTTNASNIGSGTLATGRLAAALTAQTSILNTSLVVGRDSTDQIKFSTNDQIIFRVGNADGVIFKASGEIEATSLDISGDVDVDGTLEADAITVNGSALASSATTDTTNASNIGSGTLATGRLAAALTAQTSMLNTSLVVGRDADNQIKFSTDNQMIFRVGAGDGVTFKASGEIEATSLDISGDVDVDGTLEADAITLGGTAVAVSGGAFHDGFSDFVANEHIDHSGVSIVAGDGLTGGGAIASSRTLAVGAGTGIDVAADAISVDVSDFMTNGSNNRILTATGTDAMNAEANLTFDGDTLQVTTTGTGDTLVLESSDAPAQDNDMAPNLVLLRSGIPAASTNTDAGKIQFKALDSDGGTTRLLGHIQSEFNTATGSNGSGRLRFNISSSGGSGHNDYEYLRFDGGVRDVVFNEDGRDIDVRIEGDSDTALFFTDASSDRIGIGTTSPTTKLDVSGSITVADDIIHSGDTNNKIAFGTDTQSFQTGGTARFNISDSGLQIGSGARVTTIITQSDGIGSNDNETTLPTSAAVKDYVDNNGGASALNDLSDVIASGNNNLWIAPGTTPSHGTLSSAIQNISIGNQAGDALTEGDRNISIGTAAGSGITTGEGNISIGDFAQYTQTTGSANVVVGRQALFGNGVKSNNTAFGHNALYAATTGNNNIALGFEAGNNITSGSNNLVIGDFQVDVATGDDQIIIGSGDGGVTWIKGDSNGIKALKIKVKAVSGTTTLTDAQSGSYVYWTAGTLTLPATAESGQQYTIINNTGGSATPNLGTSNAIASGWTSHAAMADETARTYVAVAANTWIYIG